MTAAETWPGRREPASIPPDHDRPEAEAKIDADADAGWSGRLTLDYRRDTLRGEPRTVVRDAHVGPLRVLASLRPEAPIVCHSVLVHPPGGIVGGDRLEIDLDVGPGAHALVTTPGATRFYRTTGAAAGQRLVARLAEGARLEWLPLETLAYSGCRAENGLSFTLAPGAESIGWDLLALGLPAAGRAFEQGRITQSIDWPGRWRERGTVDAADTRLLESPLGWAGRRALGLLWFAAGAPLAAGRRDALLDSAREAIDADPQVGDAAGVTSPHPTLVVLRVLADRVEPAMGLLARVRDAWRPLAWGLPPVAPRVWRT